VGVIGKQLTKVVSIIHSPFLVRVDLFVELFADVFEIVLLAPVVLVLGLLLLKRMSLSLLVALSVFMFILEFFMLRVVGIFLIYVLL
jgi:hypothetical protein